LDETRERQTTATREVCRIYNPPVNSGVQKNDRMMSFSNHFWPGRTFTSINEIR